MTSGIETVLDRLEGLGFCAQRGPFAPFHERLPLVEAVAWETRTAQLALLAEMDADPDEEAWRQLLLAASGLRFHLSRDVTSAFGTPVVLAIVDAPGERLLRDIAEDLAERYLLFSRVDLNLVHRPQLLDPALLDDALAPLLPRCRDLFRDGAQVARAEIGGFVRRLAAEVEGVAGGLDRRFAGVRDAATRELSDDLLDGFDSRDELPAPSPIAEIEIEEFRSIRKTSVSFAPVTVIHGPNGGGKSSILEALELEWAGTSLRRPSAVSAAEYERHLFRNGGERFVVRADGRSTTRVSEDAEADLARSVLTHEAVAALVSDSPEERYLALVATAGLRLPDLVERVTVLVDRAKARADSALTDAGLRPLPRRNSVPLDHLEAQLSSAFAARLPDTATVVEYERVLSSEPGYRPWAWPDSRTAVSALRYADMSVAESIATLAGLSDCVKALDAAAVTIAPLRDGRRAARAAIDALVSAIGRHQAGQEQSSAVLPSSHPIPTDVAVRWLAHGRSLAEAARRFEADAESMTDSAWAARLASYAADAARLSEGVPVGELEHAARLMPPARSQGPPEPEIDPALFAAAGFSQPVENPERLLPALSGMSSELSDQIRLLDDLEMSLTRHQIRRFAEHAPEIVASLCRFDLARLVKQRSPAQAASEVIVGKLLQEKLAPAVRELVAAIVRFEWHFKPLIVPERGRTVVLGGLATSQADLDARLLLNSAERTALGLAWFLALHFLQPAERRHVLVLDDPTSTLDVPNEAGFVSTLRAFVRLTRPDQVVLTTHDDAAAALLAEQFAPVDGWPESVARVRVQRDSDDASVATQVWSFSDQRSLAHEAELLGLLGGSTQVSEQPSS